MAAVVAVDVVLVGFALGGRGEGESQLARPAAPSSTPERTEATATPTAVPDVPVPASVPVRLLAVVDDLTAYRTDVDDCGADPAALEKTLDGGATWSSSAIVAETGLSSVLSLVAVDAAHVDMIGLAPVTCAPTATATYTSGLAFGDYPATLAASWYRSPGGPALVHSPSTGGVVAVPCSTVTGLVGVDDVRADALCSAGEVYRTLDGGTTWDLLDDVPGALAVAGSDGDLYLAATGVEGCAGVSVSTIAAPADEAPAATSAVPVGCAVLPEAPVDGEVVISASGDALWLWSSDIVQRSTDGGVTWS